MAIFQLPILRRHGNRWLMSAVNLSPTKLEFSSPENSFVSGTSSAKVSLAVSFLGVDPEKGGWGFTRRDQVKNTNLNQI